jgi:hypothetical protein
LAVKNGVEIASRVLTACYNCPALEA